MLTGAYSVINKAAIMQHHLSFLPAHFCGISGRVLKTL